jgi:hypothetical protein
VDFPPREEHERRLHALGADFDYVEADFPEAFDLGPILFVAETRTPWEGDVLLRRGEGGYTLADDIATSWRTWCSDWREWVQTAMLREAQDLYSYRSSYTPNDSDEWADDGQGRGRLGKRSSRSDGPDTTACLVVQRK